MAPLSVSVLFLLVSLVEIGFVNPSELKAENASSLRGLGDCGRVFLTVSSFKHTLIEMNWVVAKCDPYDPRRPDRIALYDGDPRKENLEELIILNPRNHIDEFFRTDISFGNPILPGNWNYENVTNNATPIPGSHCFPYWIASLKAGQIIDTRCLAIQPTWMADIRDDLADLEIGKAFIPGTHNSGTFTQVPFLDSYTVNQDRPIWTQLAFGIRYLDFRIGYYKVQNQFTVNHDLFSFGNVEPLFDEIKAFLQASPREIVVLDFHRFPFPKKQFPHEKFVQFLRSKFSDVALPQWMVPNSKGPTFREIWSSRRNLIICYNERNITSQNFDFLWRPIRQYWGDKRNPLDLRNFIQSTVENITKYNIHNNYNNPLWALMAELTPSRLDVIFGQNNLRQLADRVNLLVTKWFRDDWTDGVNIVATDFFLGNDLIGVAIDHNSKQKRNWPIET